MSKFRLTSLLAVGLGLCLLAAVPALAGGKPSEENCAKADKIEVKCIVCNTGEFVGVISMVPKYDPEYGDCGGNYREARNLCITAYGEQEGGMGCKWSHYMGGVTYKGWYPSGCKH